ncbi:MAG TPA: ATP-dependent helicase HrpB, partial [Candidatus Elarobacter sp.]|nr:ATP-dependent helicase HrpB [Candidatus Elarobacter sp.]
RESRVGARTRVEVVTEGILTRLIQRDPTLDGIGLLIFDEFHERSIHADTALALALHTRALLRPDLRILVMSATLDGARVAALLDDAPVITSEGRMYPVAVRYGERPEPRTLVSAVTGAVASALTATEGDVLVFLPGAGEIRRVAAALDERGLPEHVIVTPLYGDLSQQAQDAAIAPAGSGTRKIVLATPIAETSLTIEGVRVVVDSGLARAPRFSARTGMTRLETVRVSRASADQRCGRAGRLGPGTCHRLWHEHEQSHLLAHTPPEILQTDLAALALQLAAAGISDPAELRWLDAPPAAPYSQARQLLQDLEALDARGVVTAHGRRMADIGAHPRIAHMLLRAQALGLGAIACDVAALLDERDIVRGANGPPDADVRARIDAIQAIARGDVRHRVYGGEVDVARARRVVAESAALRRHLRIEPGASADSADAGLVLAFAYPDRIAQRRSDVAGERFLLRGGGGAVLPHPQALSGSEYIVAAELDGDARETRIHLGAPIGRTDIEAHFGDQIVREERVAWDEQSRGVRARVVTRLGAIPLDDVALHAPDAAAVAAVLLGVIRREGMGALPWTEHARRTRERMAFLHARHDEWPDVSDDALRDSLDEWLAPSLATVTSLAGTALDVDVLLLALLDWKQRAELDRRAPAHYVAPTGTRVPIDYADPAAPAIAVRLQEMFGVRDTPTVDDGAVALTVHLLSPARRPVQVTRDLAGFWRGSYFDVRKELRGRYPKHVWPDDPLATAPTTRAKRRGT